MLRIEIFIGPGQRMRCMTNREWMQHNEAGVQERTGLSLSQLDVHLQKRIARGCVIASKQSDNGARGRASHQHNEDNRKYAGQSASPTLLIKKENHVRGHLRKTLCNTAFQSSAASGPRFLNNFSNVAVLPKGGNF